MVMYRRSLISFLLFALCALCAVLASPPPPPATDILSVSQPQRGSVYRVGQDILVKIKIVGGVDSELYKRNPKITLYIQKDIQLNKVVGTVSACTLATTGFKFPAKKTFLIKEQPNIPFRVRASFSSPRTE
ncbi:hypothetical protein BGX26_003306 [Mortierella sp. AD094]|nr:hypothetical protein BGX26_003306 [Mortierella sp. AD094]